MQDALDLVSFVPALIGSAEIPGLERSVDAWHHRWGIAHISASGIVDAFTSLGFVHEQDGLWQMDELLRRPIGRYAEWLGPAAPAADALARRLDIVGASRRDARRVNAETCGMHDACAQGVNAFIALGHLPVEYTLLGTVPETWKPWHAIVMMRRIGFPMCSVWFKLRRAAALPFVGAEQIGQLRYDDGHPEPLCIPPGETAERCAAPLRQLAPVIAALLDAAVLDATGGGSNNWALAPTRTPSGRPLLAGDPHRMLALPNRYAQTHPACTAFDVVDLTVPGVLGFPHYGHS